MRRWFLALACFGQVLFPQLARAEGLEAYDRHGAVFTGVHPRFEHTLNGVAAEGVVHNGHWHFDWMVAKGIPMPEVGQAAVMSVQRVDDERGTHYFVYEFEIVDLDTAFRNSGSQVYVGGRDDQMAPANAQNKNSGNKKVYHD